MLNANWKTILVLGLLAVTVSACGGESSNGNNNSGSGETVSVRGMFSFPTWSQGDFKVRVMPDGDFSTILASTQIAGTASNVEFDLPVSVNLGNIMVMGFNDADSNGTYDAGENIQVFCNQVTMSKHDLYDYYYLADTALPTCTASNHTFPTIASIAVDAASYAQGDSITYTLDTNGTPMAVEAAKGFFHYPSGAIQGSVNETQPGSGVFEGVFSTTTPTLWTVNTYYLGAQVINNTLSYYTIYNYYSPKQEIRYEVREFSAGIVTLQRGVWAVTPVSLNIVAP